LRISAFTGNLRALPFVSTCAIDEKPCNFCRKSCNPKLKNHLLLNEMHSYKFGKLY
jgi:hypothetical protein